MSTRTVHDLLADRTETLEESDIEAFFVDEKGAYVSRLLDDQPYLLVGSRGIGKSMLLRYVELTSDKDYQTNKVLCVYVTFENSLVMERMEAVKGTGYFDPFRQWTFARILKEVISKSQKLGLETKFHGIMEEVYGRVPFAKLGRALERYVRILENKNITGAEELREVAEKELAIEIGEKESGDLLDALENANTLKELLNRIIEENSLRRVVFLFDEAAHALVPRQQEDFFTIFKSLRDKRITCKAAVYPAVTHYGSSFDPGHELSQFPLRWFLYRKKSPSLSTSGLVLHRSGNRNSRFHYSWCKQG